MLSKHPLHEWIKEDELLRRGSERGTLVPVLGHTVPMHRLHTFEVSLEAGVPRDTLCPS